MFRLRNLQLSAKQWVGFGVMMLVLGSLSAYAIVQMDRLRAEIDEINARSIPAVIALSSINLDVSTLRIYQLQYELLDDSLERSRLSARMATLIDSINANRDAFEHVAYGADRLDVFDVARDSLYAEFDGHWDDYQGLFIAFLFGGTERAGNLPVQLLTSAGPIYDRLVVSLEQLIDVNKQRSAYAAQRAQSNFQRSRRIIVGALIATFAFFVFLSTVLFRFVTLPIRKLDEAAQEVARGRLDVQLAVDSTDEIGSLARSFNHMTASLAAAQQQLVVKEKLASLGQLTAGIAHEIKNPLNFVNNFADLSSDIVDELGRVIDRHAPALPAADREQAEEMMSDLRLNVRKIAEHGRRADGIVKSMLLHARGTHGERQEVDLNGFVEENTTLAYHGFRASHPDVSVQIERQYDPDAGRAAIVPQDIGRVLINLLNNAFYAVGERGRAGGEAVVRVQTRAEADGVSITVADNGPGIPAPLKKRVFEPFFTTKPAGEGTGLGLSLSYDIVTHGHGGRLSMESDEGEGATFTVWLPH
ncbi:MAG: ATP-binding protein [Rhodothermales bacterium]